MTFTTTVCFCEENTVKEVESICKLQENVLVASKSFMLLKWYNHDSMEAKLSLSLQIAF